jgi:hypothetical protein
LGLEVKSSLAPVLIRFLQQPVHLHIITGRLSGLGLTERSAAE